MREKNIKVSVIIPFYNEEKYLEKSINSILNQSLTGIELILIDDGSTDNSSKIAKKYERKFSNIRYILQGNSGQGIARNNGINVARGEYLYFLDSDDYLDYKALERCYDMAIKNNSDVITFNSEFSKIDKSNFLINYSYRKLLEGNIDGIEYLKKSLEQDELFIPVWLYFYKSEFLKKNTMKFEAVLYEDRIFTLEVCTKNPKMTYINEVLHFRRIREESTMTKSKTIKHLEGAYVNILKSYSIFNQIQDYDDKLKTLSLDYVKRNINIFIGIAREVEDNKNKNILKSKVSKFLLNKSELFSIKQLIKLKIA